MKNKKKANPIKKILESRLFSQLMPVGLLLILVGVFAIATNGRLVTGTSLKIIVNQALVVAIVSTGGAFIFASGNVSLSLGATTVLTATLSVMIYNATGSLVLMMVSAVLIGVVLMATSALLSTALGVRVMYVTIVMMTMFSALQQAILGGSTVSIPTALSQSLEKGGFMYIAFGVFFLICVVLFHFTDIGRSLRFIGTNNLCAEQTGISKKKYLLIAFIIAGVGCGIGALVAVVRGGSVGTSTLTSLNMDCMLALVLGGMSIFGGSKSYVYSGVIGALTVIVLNQGLTMLQVDSTIIQAIRGVAFLALVTLSQVRPKGLPAPEG
ncbi:MAG: ABC transporter permease [Lachnospiraceae bacterium]|nr:ABC transporter permease [Lachnospiraceae bacterium]